MTDVKKNPFLGLRNKTKTITVDGETIEVKPKVKDAEMFMLMKKELTAEDAARVSEIMKNIITRANKDLDPEDIEAFIVDHYGSLMKQVAVLFGFATDADFDAVKKKLQEQ